MKNSDEKHKEQDILMMSSFIDIVKYILGNNVYDSVNQAIKSYLDEVRECSIDYSSIKDNLIKFDLESSNNMMLVARARNDFLEFCRCSGLKIEAVLNYFYSKEEIVKKYEDFLDENQRKDTKYSKYAYWWTFFKKNKPQGKEYYIIRNIFKVRDAGSHKVLGMNDIANNIRQSNQSYLSEYVISDIINFYEKEDFVLVKKQTESFVKTTLTYFSIY